MNSPPANSRTEFALRCLLAPIVVFLPGFLAWMLFGYLDLFPEEGIFRTNEKPASAVRTPNPRKAPAGFFTVDDHLAFVDPRLAVIARYWRFVLIASGLAWGAGALFCFRSTFASLAWLVVASASVGCVLAWPWIVGLAMRLL